MRHRRSLTEQERRDLIVRQGELTALAQHPSWPVLAAVLDTRRESFEREVLVKMLGGEGIGLERQAFIRGFFKGMAYVLTIPTNAETRLESILEEEAAA